ncbi:MAG: hypothetical protein KDA28_05150, partial [Phycisphaerales bacterium]|nr:hypothetical protein [Phycisphaerales bacterium]
IYNDTTGFSFIPGGLPAGANSSGFEAAHIPTTDTPGNLANDASSTYVLVRRRPNHEIVDGVSVYGAGYAFRKDIDPDQDFDGKIDFGVTVGEEIDPLQIVDAFAWSHLGGKEYVRSSEHEVSSTPAFNPDAVARVQYYGANPERGHRFNSSGELVFTRTADEELVYGEILSVGTFDDLEFNPTAVKGPTDQSGPGYDGTCDPDADAGCTPNGGPYLFDDIDLTGFGLTPGDFNDRGPIAQFRFVVGDFDFDGDVDGDDHHLIVAALGATMDDQIGCVDEDGLPVLDGNGQQIMCWAYEMRDANAILAMRDMDPADGPGGTNADEVTPSDVDVHAGLVGCEVDLNGDTALDIFDVLDFLGLFSSGDSAADWNGDTVIDIFDVLDFLGDFDVGC